MCTMQRADVRQLGEELKLILEKIRALAQQERKAKGPDADALEIAVVNLDSAVEILTD